MASSAPSAELQETLQAAVRTSLTLPARERLKFVGKTLLAAANGEALPSVDVKRVGFPISLSAAAAEMKSLSEELTIAVNAASRGGDDGWPLRAVGDQIMKAVEAVERITGLGMGSDSGGGDEPPWVRSPLHSISFTSDDWLRESHDPLTEKWKLDPEGFVRTGSKMRRDRSVRAKKPVNLERGASFLEVLPPEVLEMRLAEETRLQHIAEVADAAFALYEAIAALFHPLN